MLEKVKPRKNLWVIMVSSARKKRAAMPKKKVATMARPPAVGVGVVCEDLWFGVSIILER